MRCNTNLSEADSSLVIPAQAGTQCNSIYATSWIPAFAGMTLQHVGHRPNSMKAGIVPPTTPDQHLPLEHPYGHLVRLAARPGVLPSMTATAFHLSIAHRLWRQLPERQRRRFLTWAASLLAPAIDRAPPAVSDGVTIAGELSRASGLGEAARLILRGVRHAGVPTWMIDVGSLLPAHTADFPVASELPSAGAALILHVNAPLLPWVLYRLPRALVRGRRIIGYWLWELPTAPPEWRAGVRFVHEVWVPSEFIAGAIEPLLPGRVRVVPLPLAAARPEPSTLDRAAFGLPTDAVVVLVSFNLASSFERKNPLAAIAAFRAAFGERGDRNPADEGGQSRTCSR